MKHSDTPNVHPRIAVGSLHNNRLADKSHYVSLLLSMLRVGHHSFHEFNGTLDTMFTEQERPQIARACAEGWSGKRLLKGVREPSSVESFPRDAAGCHAQAAKVSAPKELVSDVRHDDGRDPCTQCSVYSPGAAVMYDRGALREDFGMRCTVDDQRAPIGARTHGCRDR